MSGLGLSKIGQIAMNAQDLDRAIARRTVGFAVLTLFLVSRRSP